MANFNTWKAGKTNTTIGTPTGTVITLKNLTTPPSTTSGTGDLATLTALETDVQDTISCLAEKIQAASSAGTTISTTQESILRLQDQIKDEKESIEVARDRVKYIRNPEEHTSYYESWFPLNRPLKPVSLVLLMALSLTLSFFLLLIFLSFMGFTMTAEIAGSTLNIGQYLAPLMTTSFWILLLAMTGILWFFVFRK